MGKYNVIIMGNVSRIKYKVDTSLCIWELPPRIIEYKEFLRYEELYRCELEEPFMNVGELIYIEELKLEVKIKKIAKSTNSGYVYWTDYDIETIHDEITQESKNKAEEELTRMENEKHAALQQREESARNQKCKKWYQFWK